MSVLPKSISTYGGDIDFIFWLVTILVGFWFFLTLFSLLYFLVRYRKGKNPTAVYSQGEGWKESKFIEIPHLIVLLCDVLIIVYTFTAWNRVEIDIPEPDYEVGVEGKLWYWAFRYPGPDQKLNTDDDIIVNEQNNGIMHVPVNKNIVIHISSDKTLHSFFVKELRLKQDAIPGRVISKWFNATETGKYEIACAEICGVNHWSMRNYLVVESEAAFNERMDQLASKQKIKNNLAMVGNTNGGNK